MKAAGRKAEALSLGHQHDGGKWRPVPDQDVSKCPTQARKGEALRDNRVMIDVIGVVEVDKWKADGPAKYDENESQERRANGGRLPAAPRANRLRISGRFQA